MEYMVMFHTIVWELQEIYQDYWYTIQKYGTYVLESFCWYGVSIYNLILSLPILKWL